MQSRNSLNNNKVRIIGGRFRGRKIDISPNNNIRPTPDRIRETLFNWLMLDINSTRCLDLFTGSGAISIEALSRGAEFVYLNDRNPQIVNHINKIITTFGVNPTNYKINCQDALELLQFKPHDIAEQPFDIVFLDPPFNKDYLYICLKLLIENNWLKSVIADNKSNKTQNYSLIYIEAEKTLDLEQIINNINSNNYPIKLESLKLKTAGMVNYGLFKAVIVVL